MSLQHSIFLHYDTVIVCAGLLLFSWVLIELLIYLQPSRVCSVTGILQLTECLFNLNSVELFILWGFQCSLIFLGGKKTTFLIYKSWAWSNLLILLFPLPSTVPREQKPSVSCLTPKKLNCFLKWVRSYNWKWQPDVYWNPSHFSLKPSFFLIVWSF